MDIDATAVEITDLVLPGGDGWPAPESLRAARVRVVPSWTSLFGDEIEIARIEIDALEASALRARDGSVRVLPTLLGARQREPEQPAAGTRRARRRPASRSASSRSRAARSTSTTRPSRASPGSCTSRTSRPPCATSVPRRSTARFRSRCAQCSTARSATAAYRWTAGSRRPRAISSCASRSVRWTCSRCVPTSSRRPRPRSRAARSISRSMRR